MIREEIRQQVQKLFAAGRKIRWIARHLKISRNSVREIVGSEKEASPETVAAKTPSRLERFKGAVEEMLRQEETARQKNPRIKPLTTRLIFKEISKLGYQGGRTILDDYIRQRRGPSRRSRKPWRRFETAVAEEAQQDWSPYRVIIGGKEVVIQVFSIILCWSRYQFFTAYLDQKLHTLLYGHVAAFKFFQGVPWSIAYDRQATITPCEVAGKPLINDTFKEFSAHYGFSITLCAPGHKERKGKIEKPFLHFERDFLPRRTFSSLEDLNRQILAWLNGEEFPDDGNRRRHKTTGEVPFERWLEEKKYLFELPQTDYLPRRVETRVVNHDCTVSVRGCLYTVPARLVEEGCREVWVAIGPEDLLIYDREGKLVAQHRIHEGPGKLVIDEAHYEEIRRRERPAVTRPELERQFLARFPGSEAFLESLKATLRSIAPIHLRELLALSRRYRASEFEAALKEALAHGTATAGYVRALLGRKHPTAHLGNLYRQPPRGLSLGPIDPGNTAGYEGIFEPQPERSKSDDPNHNSKS